MEDSSDELSRSRKERIGRDIAKCKVKSKEPAVERGSSPDGFEHSNFGGFGFGIEAERLEKMGFRVLLSSCGKG